MTDDPDDYPGGDPGDPDGGPDDHPGVDPDAHPDSDPDTHPGGDPDDRPGDPDAHPGGDPGDPDDVPTVTCSRCDREWRLDYELDDLQVGNRALEQFALDHERHTGHYPDDVTPWVATCRQCPDGEEFLSERPAVRWAEIHARHTLHRVELHDPTGDEPTVVDPS